MRGIDLKRWREGRGWKQIDLMTELDVKSRQTIVTWENSQEIPRLVELAIIALDQVADCNRQSGYERQFTRDKLVNKWARFTHDMLPVKDGKAFHSMKDCF